MRGQEAPHNAEERAQQRNDSDEPLVVAFAATAAAGQVELHRNLPPALLPRAPVSGEGPGRWAAGGGVTAGRGEGRAAGWAVGSQVVHGPREEQRLHTALRVRV